jgi:undecaprenol kinase
MKSGRGCGTDRRLSCESFTQTQDGRVGRYATAQASEASRSNRVLEESMNTARTSLVDSFRCAFAGLWHALRTQRNARIHLSIAIMVVLVGVALKLTQCEWAIICLTIGFVFVAEMFNTVLEAVTDLVTEEYHPLAKQAKDVAAGAVLLAAIIAVAVGLLVLGPPLLARLGSRL